MLQGHLTCILGTLLAVLMFYALPVTVYAEECRDIIPDYFDWVEQNKGVHDGAHTVGVKMSAIKIREKATDEYPWGHGSYSEGRLGWHGDEMTGRFKVLFSDRKSAVGGQRFAREKSDIQDVTLFKDGRIRVVLLTWGNATFFLDQVRCYPDGFVTGIKRESNGVSMVSLLLRKEVILSGKDGFRDWP